MPQRLRRALHQMVQSLPCTTRCKACVSFLSTLIRRLTDCGGRSFPTFFLHSWSGRGGLAAGATIAAKRNGVRRLAAALPLASLLAGGGSKLPVPKAGASSRTPQRLRHWNTALYPAEVRGRRSTVKTLLMPFLLFSAVAWAQTAGNRYADSLDLARPQEYSAYRASSGNPVEFSNMDDKQIMPGETLVIGDLAGPGMVAHIWITAAESEFAWPRLLRLRVYYDGAKTPSVDAPLGDFFAVGHGYERNVDSLMVRNSSFGRARNSYWPMPSKAAPAR